MWFFFIWVPVTSHWRAASQKADLGGWLWLHQSYLCSVTSEKGTITSIHLLSGVRCYLTLAQLFKRKEILRAKANLN